ncbi:hypothetical protein EJJ20_25670 [Pseudomonas poae]|nr:hypothetical protein EJJ20_25670 [Pseudomonas poae]
MLAPVIFISLRCTAVATANALGGCRLERPATAINIYSIIIFSGIFFQYASIGARQPPCIVSASHAGRDAGVFFAPTL